MISISFTGLFVSELCDFSADLHGRIQRGDGGLDPIPLKNQKKI